MKFNLFFISILISFFLINRVIATSLGISPPEIQLETSTNEEVCGYATIFSQDFEGTLKARDVWANKGYLERNVTAHNLDSNDIGISLKYLQVMDPFVDSVTDMICVSALEPGDYHGLLIYTAYKEGDTAALSVGTWLLVHVSPQQQSPPSNPSSSDGGGGSSIKKIINQTNSSNKIEFEALASPSSQEQTPEPQNIEGETQNNSEEPNLLSPFRIIPLILILGLVVASVFVNKKRKSIKRNA